MRSRTLADKRACWETPAKAEERDACALVVAALAADQKAKTRRRTMKSRNQETSVTGAVLAGCFKPGNLLEAQEAGVRVFWSDALSPLVEFVNSTKECNDGQ